MWSWWWCQWSAGLQQPGTAGSLSSPGSEESSVESYQTKYFFNDDKTSRLSQIGLKSFSTQIWARKIIFVRTWTFSPYKSKDRKVPTQNRNSQVSSCWNIFGAWDQRKNNKTIPLIFFLTFLLSWTLVKIEWTRQVLENIDPKESVKPAMRTQALTVQMYLKAGSEVSEESRPRMMTPE